MLSIRFMGKYRSEEQLTEDSILPVLIPVILLTLIRLKPLEGHLTFDRKTACIAGLAVVCYFLLKTAHEYIHALCYPLGAQKTIWMYGRNGVLFCYCNAPVSKLRFIVISLAPMVILGIIPFIVWMFAAGSLSIAVNIAVVFMIWIMIFFAMGDAANVYNTIRQVSKDAAVIHYGMHSYWVAADKASRISE